MLKEAVAHYHELLEDVELTEASPALWTTDWKAQNLFLAAPLIAIFASAFCHRSRLAARTIDLRNRLECAAKSQRRGDRK